MALLLMSMPWGTQACLVLFKTLWGDLDKSLALSDHHCPHLCGKNTAAQLRGSCIKLMVEKSLPHLRAGHRCSSHVPAHVCNPELLLETWALCIQNMSGNIGSCGSPSRKGELCSIDVCD